MKLVIVTIQDKKAEEFGLIYAAKNIATAERDFASACKENPNFNKYPEDYALYAIGNYNQETAQITPWDKPRLICEATKYAIKKGDEPCQEDTK